MYYMLSVLALFALANNGISNFAFIKEPMSTEESNKPLSNHKEMCIVDGLTRKISNVIGPILAAELEAEVQKNLEISRHLAKLQQEHTILQEKYQALLEQMAQSKQPLEENQAKDLTLQSKATEAQDLLHENESIFDNLVSIVDNGPIITSDFEFDEAKPPISKQCQNTTTTKGLPSVTNLRRKSDRKNAHAKDCPCCSKVRFVINLALFR